MTNPILLKANVNKEQALEAMDFLYSEISMVCHSYKLTKLLPETSRPINSQFIWWFVII